MTMDKFIEASMAHLEALVGFETVSGRSNLDFIDYIRTQLDRQGVESFISYDETGQRANLHAVIGPLVDGGVVLNGHSDVVPVDGQRWSSPPFELTRRGDRLFGRGSVDMKGYLACMLAGVPLWQQKKLKKPVHISICYDEEIGGFGAPVLVADMARTAPHPAIAIVGEPTGMKMVTAHKGGLELRTVITGLDCHSSDPRVGVNAIFYAVRVIARLEEIGQRLAGDPEKDSVFEPPYTTVNVGAIEGGAATNIVAGNCWFKWEVRPMPDFDGRQVVAELAEFVHKELLPQMRKVSPDANIETIVEADIPGLGPQQGEPAVELIAAVTGLNSTSAVSFGTDGGHFAHGGISTIVMGPGSIDRAHKADEYIEVSELEDCMKFFDKLGDELARRTGMGKP